MPAAPAPFGLYDPAFEHDACGVGFVAHLKGRASRDIVESGLDLLVRLDHRGATGADPLTGDGAGILLQLPHALLEREARKVGLDLPRRGAWAVGMVFLPADHQARAACELALTEAIASEGQRLLGWRDVPVRPEALGVDARACMPVIRQVFVARRRLVPSAFERKLYVIRKLAENRVRGLGIDPKRQFHLASFSAETLVYKGMLLPRQLAAFYPDLSDPHLVSAIALVHSRFSTNTFPSWALAQPMRFLAHNGEINTLRGNRNWMNARRSMLESAKFPGGLDRLFPIVVPEASDSAQLDNMLELLHLGGRTLPHALMMMVPEAWEQNTHMDPARHAFYEYTASLMEPWDGPAALCFTDGTLIGATLDRNGLRPLRWVVTEDDRVILASEAGVVDVPAALVREKGRLQPGRMFIVDTGEGRILDDDAVKGEIVSRWPYARWLKQNVFRLDDVRGARAEPPLLGDAQHWALRAFGYTDEDLDLLVLPMAETGEEPTGSMGNDAPLAVLSRHAPNLFDYFHQQFAQVTNPPIDSIREKLVMSLATGIGQDGNTFEETPEQCHRVVTDGPVLTNEQLAKLRGLRAGAFEPTTLTLLYRVDNDDADALDKAVDRLCQAANEAVDDGYNLLILSDRGVDARHAAIPSLLALSAVHQHLVREGTRMHTGLVVETGEAREVHHFALLLGFGAAAINPYLALDALTTRAKDGPAAELSVDAATAHQHFVKAIHKGLLKVMSKMGISTLQSYRGAQVFEAVGLDGELVARHFTGTISRLSGVGLRALDRENRVRHGRAMAAGDTDLLPVGGRYRWRRRGEHHQWNPRTIALLQDAARRNDAATFAEFERAVDGGGPDDQGQVPTLRHRLEHFAPPGQAPVPLAEVESAADIARRFVTGAMSLGSISPEAHEALAVAMNRLGGRSNSGEGGEEPHRYVPDANGDSRRSSVKQIASGRFGVTVEYLVEADDLQIKVAQGAKPGEGGQLPGHKVNERIARVRCSTPGVTLISPPPHHDIYSIEDLKQLIYDLRSVNPHARISVKLVAQAGVGTVAAGVAKAGADVVVIAGWSGGTGASPLSSLKHAGVPWELGIAEAQQVLMANGLRRHVRLQVDGGFRTGRDVVIAALLGGEEFGFATAALIVEGCIMLRKCHKNTCSVGVATQDPELRARFTGDPDHIVNYFLQVAESTRQHMAALGFRHIDDMVGRVDCLRTREDDALRSNGRGRAEDDAEHFKAALLDLSPLLARAPVAADAPARCLGFRQADDAGHLDHDLLAAAASVLARAPGVPAAPLVIERPIRNTDRAVGARLSGAIARLRPDRQGAAGLPDGSIDLRLKGSAGQSLGAWLAAGVNLRLEGESNDYLGKGLSGGRIVLVPPAGARFVPEDNIITGNVALYGATGGEVFINGRAGERFAVRNSGARAVVEGLGDHGCEYMTGGVVVVLGSTGRNFAAGMSGGLAFVFDPNQTFRSRCNPGMVVLEAVRDPSDVWLLQGLVEAHLRHTQSPLAQRILDNWPLFVGRFIKVLPVEYKRVLEAARAEGGAANGAAGAPAAVPVRGATTVRTTPAVVAG